MAGWQLRSGMVCSQRVSSADELFSQRAAFILHDSGDAGNTIWRSRHSPTSA